MQDALLGEKGFEIVTAIFASAVRAENFKGCRELSLDHFSELLKFGKNFIFIVVNTTSKNKYDRQ